MPSSSRMPPRTLPCRCRVRNDCREEQRSPTPKIGARFWSPFRFAVRAMSKLSANDLDMLRRFYDELARLDELHQELISNPEKDQMNRFLIAAITLVALTAAAQAEIMCTHNGGCWETGMRIYNNGAAYQWLPRPKKPVRIINTPARQPTR